MLISMDTETCLFKRALKAPPLVCVSFATQNKSGLRLWKNSEEFCRKAISTHRTLWAFAPFDLAVIGNQFPKLIDPIFEALADDRVHDVQIRQKLIDIAEGRYRGFYRNSEGTFKINYSVQGLAKRLLGEDVEKEGTWRLRYAELREIPIKDWPKEARDYAIKDAEILLPIYDKQEAEVHNEPEILYNQFAQSRADIALHLSSCWGIRTDSDAVRELDRRTEEEWESIRDKLKKVGLIQKNGARDTKYAKRLLQKYLDPDQLALTVTGERKVKNKELTREEAIKAGYIKLDEESCLASKSKRLQAYARFGALIKLRSTYVSALKTGIEKPIQTYFEVLLETGRTSSSGPNLQNPPRAPGVRECFVPRKGCVFIGADFDQAELCSLSQTCLEWFGYSRMAERLNAKMDVHLDMAAQIMGISYKEAKILKDAEDPHMDEMRNLAKAADFGFPGGLGPDSFIQFAKGYGVLITREQAVELRRKWHQAWPEMKEYFHRINAMQQANGLIWIKQPISERCRGRAKYTQACNQPFQGRTADAAKDALWEITLRQFARPKSALYGSHIVLFLHDEIIIEALEERSHDAAMELQKVMVKSFVKYHPDMEKAAGAKPVIMRRWYKKPKQVWSKEGILLPYDGEEKKAA